MVGSQHTLIALKRALEERLGLPVVALVEIQRRQIVHARECLGLIRPQHALIALERALEEQLGLAIAALVEIQRRQVVYADKRIGMLRAEQPLWAASARFKSGSASP